MLQSVQDYLLGMGMSSEVLIEFVSSFIIWNVVNYIVMCLNLPDKHLKRNDMLDMRNRIVSFCHGLTMVLLAGYHYYIIKSDCG